MTLESEFQKEVDSLAAAGRLRSTTAYSGLERTRPSIDHHRELISFATNDYLGLSSAPSVRAAAHQSIDKSGSGSGASRLVTGETPYHRDLEVSLATYLGVEDVLLFPTGYQTNIGVLTALAGPNDLIVSDAANHASIIDGCRLSRAQIAIYPHLDARAATAALANPSSFRRRILVTESVFSMDGDRAPLAELASATRAQGAVLVVDEAHALGVTGPDGRGVAADCGVTPDVVVGTLGKAMGSHGGFAAGTALLRRILINRARPFIYSTAGPPSAAAAALAALALLRSPAGQELRARAAFLAGHARLCLRSAGIEVPGQDLILPLVIGEEGDALRVSQELLSRDLLVPAIRPPTVPAGTSRLRITISAAHTTQEVDRLVDALASALPLTRNRPEHNSTP
ncbi:MAG: 8-amino-7-oxononanoate synthase [Myxococcales bacterium]